MVRDAQHDINTLNREVITNIEELAELAGEGALRTGQPCFSKRGGGFIRRWRWRSWWAGGGHGCWMHQ